MGSGFSKMKKQARMLEQQFEKMREDMKNIEATGISGNGLVTVILDGDKKLKSIAIKPECVDASDVEGLQDLIKAAFEDAFKKIEEKTSQNSLPGMPASMSLPFGF
jgi:hypothetical protein